MGGPGRGQQLPRWAGRICFFCSRWETERFALRNTTSGFNKTFAASPAAAKPAARVQSNGCLQSIDVTHCAHMDASWQKLLNHVARGRAKA